MAPIIWVIAPHMVWAAGTGSLFSGLSCSCDSQVAVQLKHTNEAPYTLLHIRILQGLWVSQAAVTERWP